MQSQTPWAIAHQAPLSVNFPSKNMEVGCHSLIQGIFLTQGSNLSLLNWQADSLPVNHLKKNTCLVNKCFLHTYEVPGNYFRHLGPVNEHNRDFYLHGA